jgi:rRNA maturation endonuclease Nob1
MLDQVTLLQQVTTLLFLHFKVAEVAEEQAEVHYIAPIDMEIHSITTAVQVAEEQAETLMVVMADRLLEEAKAMVHYPSLQQVEQQEDLEAVVAVATVVQVQVEQQEF